mmetsp:Transcript_959/g.2191  ORF Transcript_959/g.2191 Transcript_959/m.2191 type:complete len:297 (-) Transcript_959:202-1092(-)
MLPLALVFWIVNQFWCPFSFVVGVFNHWCLPFTIVFIVPVVGLNGIWLRYFFHTVLVPIVGLFVLGIDNFGIIDPVFGLFDLGILDCLGFVRKVKILGEITRFHQLSVDKDFESVGGVDNQCIEVCKIIIFHANCFLDEKVFVLFKVVQNDVCFFVGRSAQIGAEHDGIGRIASKGGTVEFISTGKKFEVGTTAFQVLFVLYGILHHKGLVTAHKGFVELGGKTEKSSVSDGFDTLVVLVTVKIPGGVLPRTHISLGFPSSRFSPSTSPVIVVEIFGQVEFRRNGSDACSSTDGKG